MSEYIGGMKHIGELAKKSGQDIIINSRDPVLQKGFTQIPNFILEDSTIDPGAKLVYVLLLKYAWEKDKVFPGQDRLAADAGLSRSSVSEKIQKLKKKGWIEIERRGLGRTNIYKVNFRVKTPKKKKFGGG